MRIAFDGTTLRPGRTGVGYYTEHLLHHLAAAGTGDDIVLLSNRSVETTRPLPPAVGVPAVSWHIPRMMWMQTVAARTLRRIQPDVAHFTNGMIPLASPVPTVVTIHDMSLTLLPRFHPPRRVLLNRPFVDLAARRADAVITVSESARRDIMRLYDLAPDRVHVIHEAAAPSFRPIRDVGELERVKRRYQLADRFILYVGTIEPRKNLSKLIEGFASRRRSGDLNHQLVLAGPYGWLCRHLAGLIERLNIAHAIRFTGYLPFDDLPALYSLAEMFVFPSRYEGFGLPVIEAMACGTPVVTGEAAALAEVAGPAVERLDPLSAEGLGEAIVRLGASPERRAELSHLGLRRSEAFSWARAAQETLGVYRQVAGQPAHVHAHEPATSVAP